MASVINSLLVGIGFDVDKKSADNVTSSIDQIQSKALQLGSLVAGAFGANALTFGFAQSTDELGKFSERFNVAATDVSAYGRALEHAGGNASDFLGTIQNLTQLQSQSAQNKAGMLAGLAPEGIDRQVASVINAKNSLDGFLNAADAIQQLDPARQERFIQAMGFSDGEVRLLRSGRAEILKSVQAEKNMRPVTEQMTTVAAKFNDEWQDLTTNIGGFSDTVATPLVKGINTILVKTNGWLSANRELIKSFAGFTGDAIGKNIDLIAVAMATMGAAGVIAGLKSVAGLVASITGSLVSGAAVIAPWVAAATALYAITTEGGEGGKFSASSIFGSNGFTTFLDKPISELFPTESYNQSAMEKVRGRDSHIKIQNQVILDGKIISDKVNDVIETQVNNMVQDHTNSEAN